MQGGARAGARDVRVAEVAEEQSDAGPGSSVAVLPVRFHASHPGTQHWPNLQRALHPVTATAAGRSPRHSGGLSRSAVWRISAGDVRLGRLSAPHRPGFLRGSGMPTVTAIAASNPDEREPVGPSRGVRALATVAPVVVLLGMRGLFPVLAAGRDHGGATLRGFAIYSGTGSYEVWSGATNLLEEWGLSPAVPLKRRP